MRGQLMRLKKQGFFEKIATIFVSKVAFGRPDWQGEIKEHKHLRVRSATSNGRRSIGITAMQ
jgi:hypothetical protein